MELWFWIKEKYMFTNALTGANYEFQNANLWELREKIIEQEHLTTLDILKGFHEKSKIKVELPKKSDPFLDNIIDDASSIYEGILQNRLDKYLKEMEDEVESALVECYNKTCKKENCHVQGEVTLDSLMESYGKYERAFSVDFRNLVSSYKRKIEYGYRETEKDGFVKLVNERLPEGFVATTRYCDGLNVFPKEVELNDLSFLEKPLYVKMKTHATHFDIKSTSNRFKDSLRKYVSSSNTVFTDVTVCKLLSKEEVALLEQYILDKLNEEYKVPAMRYLQELETSPITININEENGRIELLDGYKRLLVTNNKDLLDRNVAIKVFKNLSDKDFLTLLYAANYWKHSMGNRISDIAFHDRGFLFALKQKYGIEFKDFDCKQMGLFDFLNIYDSNQRSKFAKSIPYLTLKHSDMTSSYDKHEHLVSDLENVAKNLSYVYEKDCGYDENIKQFLIPMVIACLGDIRRNGTSQRTATAEDVVAILEDKSFVRMLSKKHYTTDTYISNFVIDKGLDSKIYEMLESRICLEPREKKKTQETQEVCIEEQDINEIEL